MLGQVGSLSNEEREKLTRFQPKTIGEANRISGITPNAMVILYSLSKKAAKALRVERGSRIGATAGVDGGAV